MTISPLRRATSEAPVAVEHNEELGTGGPATGTDDPLDDSEGLGEDVLL
jgi:hypothetical protein